MSSLHVNSKPVSATEIHALIDAAIAAQDIELLERLSIELSNAAWHARWNDRAAIRRKANAPWPGSKVG